MNVFFHSKNKEKSWWRRDRGLKQLQLTCMLPHYEHDLIPFDWFLLKKSQRKRILLPFSLFHLLFRFDCLSLIRRGFFLFLIENREIKARESRARIYNEQIEDYKDVSNKSWGDGRKENYVLSIRVLQVNVSMHDLTSNTHFVRHLTEDLEN